MLAKADGFRHVPRYGAPLFTRSSRRFPDPVCSAETPEAQATARVFDHIRSDPTRLTLFMRSFPKGGDLHNHLAGAIPAESFLDWAGEDGLCASLAQGRILPTKCRLATPGDIPVSQLRPMTTHGLS